MKLGVYHGCHNTFVVMTYLDGVEYSAIAKEYCAVYQTDGLLVLKNAPLEMLFYNADGSRAPMCGNGLRCFARFAYELGVIDTSWTNVVTLGGLMKVKITSLEPFTVIASLGKPDYSTIRLDIDSDLPTFLDQELEVSGKVYNISCVFLGTHHAVVFVPDFEDLPGYELCHHPIFKKQINVNFVKVTGKDTLFVRTFERGVGWTQACGSGASSSVLIAMRKGLVGDEVRVDFLGGTVTIRVVDGEVLMEGPAEVMMEVQSEEEDS